MNINSKHDTSDTRESRTYVTKEDLYFLRDVEDPLVLHYSYFARNRKKEGKVYRDNTENKTQPVSSHIPFPSFRR